jgi:hypothetical protein
MGIKNMNKYKRYEKVRTKTNKNPPINMDEVTDIKVRRYAGFLIPNNSKRFLAAKLPSNLNAGRIFNIARQMFMENRNLAKNVSPQFYLKQERQ